jgi:Arc/MetJ-type ribon-helix-helix transcriptional regulator
MKQISLGLPNDLWGAISRLVDRGEYGGMEDAILDLLRIGLSFRGRRHGITVVPERLPEPLKPGPPLRPERWPDHYEF